MFTIVSHGTYVGERRWNISLFTITKICGTKHFKAILSVCVCDSIVDIPLGGVPTESMSGLCLNVAHNEIVNPASRKLH